MSFLQFMRVDVQDIMSKVSSQHQQTGGVMDQIKSYVPMVQGSWKGGDADEFAQDVGRKLVPAITELMLAIAGINVNLTKGTNIMDNADKQTKSLADGLGDVFGKI
jgi:WXG100 family type VII secretion target